MQKITRNLACIFVFEFYAKPLIFERKKLREVRASVQTANNDCGIDFFCILHQKSGKRNVIDIPKPMMFKMFCNYFWISDQVNRFFMFATLSRILFARFEK